MWEERRWKRPGRAAGRVGVVRETAVVVAAWVSSGREKLGGAGVVSSVAVVVWACGRRGRWGVAVAPYVVVDRARAVRRREDAEFVVGIAAVFASSAAFWREARFWVWFFVDDISEERL